MAKPSPACVSSIFKQWSWCTNPLSNRCNRGQWMLAKGCSHSNCFDSCMSTLSDRSNKKTLWHVMARFFEPQPRPSPPLVHPPRLVFSDLPRLVEPSQSSLRSVARKIHHSSNLGSGKRGAWTGPMAWWYRTDPDDPSDVGRRTKDGQNEGSPCSDPKTETECLP